MRFARICSVLTAAFLAPAAMILGQAAGDYGSAGTGPWGTTGANWVVCQSAGSWSGATAAPGAPTSLTNVWIRAGHTVTLEAGGKSCLNLAIETGGVLEGNTPLPALTIHYLQVSGGTVTVNGVFGGSSAPGTNAALEAAASGATLTITGTGTFEPARMRVASGVTAVTIVFDMNTTFRYRGPTAGSDGVALYPQTDNNVFTVNAGKTLTFVDSSGLSVASSNGAAAGTNLTINVSGSITLTEGGDLTLRTLAGRTAALNIAPGGSVLVGGTLYGSTVADGGTTAITVDGSLIAGGEADFGNPSFVMTGSGSFTLSLGGHMNVGHPGGIASSGASGQIQTGTRSFSTAAGYSYVGTAPQNTGTGLPASVVRLAVNNSSGLSLTASTTVIDTLTFTQGTITTNANTLTLGPAGTVARTDGHVIGSFRKSVPAGAGIARSFEIGTVGAYAPVGLAFGTVSTGGTLTAGTTAGDHPNLAAGSIEVTKSVNRFWTLASSGLVFDACNATFHFAGGDPDPGSHPGVFVAEKYSGGSWSGLTEGTRGSTSTQVLGLASFSDFAIGEEEGASPAPAFELSVPSLSLGNVPTMSSRTDSVQVRSIGTASLSVSGIVSTNPSIFGVTPAGAALAPGESAAVHITFSPSSPGSVGGKIVFTHDGAGSPDTLPVSGTGISSSAILSNGAGGGDWALPGTWQGGIVPQGTDSVVVAAGDTVTVTADTSCMGIHIQPGATLRAEALCEVDNATILGAVVARGAGRFYPTDSARFEGGSVYEHARDGGDMPVAGWAPGSLCRITGAASSAPANGSQSYHDITWNCPGQLSNLNMGWDSITIGGDIRIVSTSSARWQMTAPLAGDSSTVTILGDIIQTGGNFSSNGTGNALTRVTIHHHGNVYVTGGNFSVSRGSQGGTGSTRWYLYGDTMSLANATTQNSNTDGYARFIFAGASPQVLSLASVTFGGGGFPVLVPSGSTLLTGTSVIRGSGAFEAEAGAAIACGQTGGVDSLLAGTGTRSLSTGSSYIFNGSFPQRTGRRMPDTLNALTVLNPAGVLLSDSIQVNGTLTLTAGDLGLNGKRIVLGPTGLLSETPGNTVEGSSGIITTTRTLNAPSGAAEIAGLGISIQSAANLGITTVSRGHSLQTVAGTNALLRWFDISPANNTGLNATLKFRYDESELYGMSEATLQLQKSADGGASWTAMGGTVNAAANTIEIPGQDGLSRWTATGSFGVSVPLSAGWNMISNPMNAPNDSVWALFPTAAFPYAFSFSTSGGYVQQTRLLNGMGYWEKFPAAVTQPLPGGPRLEETITLAAGWNMIGSISPPVDTSSILESPAGIVTTPYYGFTTTYTPVQTLEPGRAYWVKSSAGGQILLSATSPSRSAGAPGDPFGGLSRVSVTDGEGRCQTLYAGEGLPMPADFYELPPPGPEGTFDVRFATGRAAEIMGGDAPLAHEVLLSGATPPLSVSWKMTGGMRLALTAGAAPERILSGEGRLVLTGGGIGRLVLTRKGGEIPSEYALGASYPNPFNSTASFDVRIARGGRVEVAVYDILGRRAAVLMSGETEPGVYPLRWDATGFASGVYFYRMEARPSEGGAGFSAVRTMMHLK
ncbi:MAG: hypothetical protein WB626_09750 [Bacteroidota bacterium]